MMIIEVLSCAFLENVCVSMQQFVNRETNTRLELNVNVLSCDMINMNNVFCCIQVHSSHTIVVNMINSDKIFQRQMIEIHKLYEKKMLLIKRIFFWSFRENKRVNKHLCTLFSWDNDITIDSTLQFIANKSREIRACFIQWREIDYWINSHWQNHDWFEIRDVVLLENYKRD